MNLSRLQRLVQLVALLQTGRGYNANALAAECRVNRRTVFRDLEVLREAGLPLEFSEEFQVYRLPGNITLPPTQFTPEEALAAIVLCGQLRDGGQFPFPQAARSVAHKLESVLPAKLREHLRDAGSAIEQLPQPTSAPVAGYDSGYQQLVDAIRTRRMIRIEYQGPLDQQPTRTKLHPYRLLWSRHSWYVIGRSTLHRAVRTFHVGRIRQLTVTDEPFRIPQGFRIERYLRNAWHLIPEKGADRRIVLRFSPLVAKNVAGVVWHRTQRCEPQPDGGMLFHATVSGLNEISWWILGYGDQVEVLDPPELRTLIASRVERMHRIYRPDETT